MALVAEQKKLLSVGAAIGVVALLISLIAVFAHALKTTPMPAQQKISQVTIGTTAVQVEVADTDAKRELGLSYRDALLPGHGMLFVFDTPDTYGFWMKDMSFPIDMLFADKGGKVVTIYKNVSPDSYLKNPPDIFYPTSPALYVLEVTAGFAKEQGIVEGDKIVVQ